MRGAKVSDTVEGNVLIYRDASAALQVRLDGATVWLSQRQIAELYQTSPQNITQHISRIFGDGELDELSTCKDYLQVQVEGARSVERSVHHYDLSVIIAVGYRVRSTRGTQFRQWATARLSELLVKGFTMDDERLKAGRTIGADYFDELLTRIRDIRSSERLFYQKIADIYATSIDYDSNAEVTRLFYLTVQNKMHWAAHGHTAAEIICERADADQPNMGLTSWKNAPAQSIRKSDTVVAKNYLAKDELQALNLVVSAYLDFAELQASAHRPMYMSDWAAKLDDFLRLSDRDVLENAGSISHALAEEHASAEYERFRKHRVALESSEPSSDFDRAIRHLKELS